MEKSDGQIREEIMSLAAKIARILEQGGRETLAGLQGLLHESDTALLHETLGWMEHEGKIRMIKEGEKLEIELVG